MSAPDLSGDFIAQGSSLPTYRRVQFCRATSATTFDAELAQAFGAAVRALRAERGIAQELLANLAGVERSHMGKVERGEHMPTLAIIFKIAGALECSVAELMASMEALIAFTTPSV